MTLLPDSAARTRVESDTAATLFVEAGAGTVDLDGHDVVDFVVDVEFVFDVVDDLE